MAVFYVMPTVTTKEDIWRHLRYVPVCGFRFVFRGGGCE